MDPLQTFSIEVRPSAEEQVSKPPCKGLCKDCKRAASNTQEPVQMQAQAVTFANNRD